MILVYKGSSHAERITACGRKGTISFPISNFKTERGREAGEVAARPIAVRGLFVKPVRDRIPGCPVAGAKSKYSGFGAVNRPRRIKNTCRDCKCSDSKVGPEGHDPPTFRL